MNDSRLSRRLAATILTASLIFSTNSHGAQTVQPGFISHEPSELAIRVNDASSGYVCGAEEGPSKVCVKAIQIIVTDEEICDLPNDTQYPCTRYGYQFDYQGADPSVSIDCKFKRFNPSAFGPRSETAEYAVELKDDQGHIFHPLFIKYTPVDKRVIISEVHECYYSGVLLTTIEHILYLEPDLSPDDAALLAEFGQCGKPGFGNFRVPANLPASAGTVSTPKAGGSWEVKNFEGQMACAGMNMPLAPNQESGAIELKDDGKTLVAIGFDDETAPLTMRAVPGITGRYAGSVGGSQDGIPMTIDFCWQLITDEWITGFLRSEVSTQGVTCKMSRDSELKRSGQ